MLAPRKHVNEYPSAAQQQYLPHGKGSRTAAGLGKEFCCLTRDRGRQGTRTTMMSLAVLMLLVTLLPRGFDKALPLRGLTMLRKEPCRTALITPTLPHLSRVFMSSTATKLDTRISQKTATKPSLKEQIEKNWRLILHDDNVHTVEYVADLLEKLVPLCSGPRAYKVTLEVHMTGQATVCVSNRKLIDEYSLRLQQEGLTVSTAPDDEFEAESDDGEGDGSS